MTKTLVNAVLQSLQYSNSSSDPPTSVNLQYTFNDGYGVNGITTATTAVNIIQINNPPTVTAPASISFNQNANFVFNGANAITVNDVDSDGGQELVTLTATNGVIDLASAAGVTITAGSNGSNTITFKGTIAQLNSALTNLTFVPTLNYHGSASLVVSVNDQGNAGRDGGDQANGQSPSRWNRHQHKTGDERDQYQPGQHVMVCQKFS